MEEQNINEAEEAIEEVAAEEVVNEAADEATEENTTEETRDVETVIMREWEGHKKQWKSTIEEFELQLALGKSEAADKFEEWKEAFGKFVSERKLSLTDDKEGADWEDVKGKFENLEVQLALGKMELKDAYDEQKDKILEAIDAAKRSLQAALGKIDDEFQEEAESFRAKLEGYQVQFALGKYEARDAIEDKKSELRDLVHDFRSKMDAADEPKAEEKDDDKFESFVAEMGKSYEHLKSAFVGLID